VLRLLSDDFKYAHVNPVLKKASLPKEDLNSYRPIFILSFISKVLQKVVADCLMSHIHTNTNNFTPHKLLF